MYATAGIAHQNEFFVTDFSVIPAQAGIHIPETVVMDSRLRGNDG
jgi:hypothetical protein